MIRNKNQLRLNVRFYRVAVQGFPDAQIQAANRAAAKWQVFKSLREAGYVAGFRDFLRRGVKAREVRR
jgi:hypothetical protein